MKDILCISPLGKRKKQAKKAFLHNLQGRKDERDLNGGLSNMEEE